MAIKPGEHRCKLSDLVRGNKPIVDGECVSIPLRCRVCGKKYEEVYTINDGLWDPDLKEYVDLE